VGEEGAGCGFLVNENNQKHVRKRGLVFLEGEIGFRTCVGPHRTGDRGGHAKHCHRSMISEKARKLK